MEGGEEGGRGSGEGGRGSGEGGRGRDGVRERTRAKPGNQLVDV